MRNLIFSPSKALVKKYQEVMIKPDKEESEYIKGLFSLRQRVISWINKNESIREYLANEITDMAIGIAKDQAILNSHEALRFPLTENGYFIKEIASEAVDRLSLGIKMDSRLFLAMLSGELTDVLRKGVFYICWGKIFIEEGEIVVEVFKDGFKLPDHDFELL